MNPLVIIALVTFVIVAVVVTIVLVHHSWVKKHKIVKDLSKAQPLLEQYRKQIPAKVFSDFIDKENYTLEEGMLLIAQAVPRYLDNAYMVPISKFRVGAAVRDEHGNIYIGVNTEFVNAPLSTCIHAEQSSIHNAYINQVRKITHLAVNEAPCGYCRQFINEMENAADLIIIMANPKDKSEIMAKKFQQDFLPYNFGPAELGQKGGLLTNPRAMTSGATYDWSLLSTLDPRKILSFLTKPDPSQITSLLTEYSYCPYTNVGAGCVAFSLTPAPVGSVSLGVYMENCAYDPSLNPMVAMINLTLVQGHLSLKDINLIYATQSNVKPPTIDLVSEMQLIFNGLKQGGYLNPAAIFQVIP